MKANVAVKVLVTFWYEYDNVPDLRKAREQAKLNVENTLDGVKHIDTFNVESIIAEEELE